MYENINFFIFNVNGVDEWLSNEYKNGNCKWILVEVFIDKLINYFKIFD